MTPQPDRVAQVVAPSQRPTLSIYDKPKPARLILADALGIDHNTAAEAMRALIAGGYAVVPRNPTNGMLAAYIQVTTPARGHEAVITAISKARVRWQAMLEQGSAVALSLKYMPAIEAGEPFKETPDE